MLKIGEYNKLVVEREVSFGFYLNPKEEEVLLPGKYAPPGLSPGDTITVFVYTDSEDRPVATTQEPSAVVGDFVFLEVLDTKEFGVFLNWNLEKDLFVPKSEMQDRMKKGEKHLVKVCLDEKTNRVYATTRISENCSKTVENIEEGSPAYLLIYSINKLGALAIVDGKYSGMLYKNEIFEPLKIGEERTGFVTKIREDGKIDLQLKKPGFGSVTDSSNRILAVLEKAGGFVACHDKSSPDLIKDTFSMSKKEFKRTIGRLYKTGKIEISDKGIDLK